MKVADVIYASMGFKLKNILSHGTFIFNIHWICRWKGHLFLVKNLILPRFVSTYLDEQNIQLHFSLEASMVVNYCLLLPIVW